MLVFPYIILAVWSFDNFIADKIVSRHQSLIRTIVFPSWCFDQDSLYWVRHDGNILVRKQDILMIKWPFTFPSSNRTEKLNFAMILCKETNCLHLKSLLKCFILHIYFISSVVKFNPTNDMFLMVWNEVK